MFSSLGGKSFSGLIPPQSETVVFLTGFFALFAAITLISFQGYNDNHRAFDQLLKNYAPQQDNLVQNNAPVSLLDSLLDVVERLGLVPKRIYDGTFRRKWLFPPLSARKTVLFSTLISTVSECSGTVGGLLCGQQDFLQNNTVNASLFYARGNCLLFDYYNSE